MRNYHNKRENCPARAASLVLRAASYRTKSNLRALHLMCGSDGGGRYGIRPIKKEWFYIIRCLPALPSFCLSEAL